MIDLVRTSHALWAQLGLTLAHFLWQGAAIALVLAAVLWLIRKRSAGERYAACGLAMLLMAICPLLTLCYVRAKPPPILAAATRISIDAPEMRFSTIALVPVPEPAGQTPSATEDTVPVAPGPDVPAWAADTPESVESIPPASTGSTAIALEPAGPRTRPQWLVWGFCLAAVLWLAGVAALALRLMFGWLSLRRLRRRDTEPLATALERAVRRLRERLSVARHVRVRATRAVAEPVAFGLVKPVVLLPVSMLTQCPVELVEALIAHELAHIRRYDLWVNLFQRVVETLLFYHPAVWWVSGRMRLERELCCDDLAVGATGRRTDYATALVELSLGPHRPVAAALAAGASGTKVSLLTRVRRVLQVPEPHHRGHFWIAGPLSLLLAGSLVLVAHVHAADSAAPEATGEPAGAQPASAKEPSSDSEGVSSPITSEPENAAPRTAMIETNFGEAASFKKKVEQQRAMLTPVVDVIKAFYAFHDALYDRDVAELQRRFRPSGKPATQENVEQLLADLKVLGIDRDQCRPWVVEDVIMPAPEAKQAALVCCYQFDSVYGGMCWLMQVSCWLVPDETRGWSVERISLVPEEDRELVRRRFGARLCEGLLPNEAIAVRCFKFGDGRPRSFRRYDVVATVDPTKPGQAARSSRWSGRMDVLEFTEPVKQWRCFEVPAPVRRRSAATPMRSRSGPPRAAMCSSQAPAGVNTIRTSVRALADGIVAEVKVKVGQSVKKGDLLVRLDDEEIKIELKAAEIRFGSAKSEYERLRAMVDKEMASAREFEKAELAVALAGIDLERWRLRLKRTQIVSPTDGVVVQFGSGFPSGKKVAAGDELLVIESKEKAPTSEDEAPSEAPKSGGS